MPSRSDGLFGITFGLDQFFVGQAQPHGNVFGKDAIEQEQKIQAGLFFIGWC
jgi:hypothetical protein